MFVFAMVCNCYIFFVANNAPCFHFVTRLTFVYFWKKKTVLIPPFIERYNLKESKNPNEYM